MNARKADYPIMDIILNRWSRRAMTAQSVPHEQLLCLFEAARWAASSYNNQPWRFIYAHRQTAQWSVLFNLLVPANQEWCVNAGVLIVALSHTLFEYNNKPSRTHSLDTGAATQNLALQGYSMGLVVHGLEGFDYDLARKELGVPEEYAVEAMYAIGIPGDPKATLSPKLQEREVPSDRKHIEEFIYNGVFGNK